MTQHKTRLARIAKHIQANNRVTIAELTDQGNFKIGDRLLSPQAFHDYICGKSIDPQDGGRIVIIDDIPPETIEGMQHE